jgi:gamma-glutamyltranspeptidase / glutathione hydrolase
MVVAPQPEAVEVGVDILRAGGNAVDAALGCAFLQSVVDPLMCGIAGLGSMAVYLPQRGALHECLDFHAPAPLAATSTMWEELVESEARDGFGFRLRGRVNELGYQSIAVPAGLRGFHEAHRLYGHLPWGDLIEPAIRAANDGWFVRPAVYAFWNAEGDMGRADNAERLRYSASGRQLYCRADGSPKRIGEWVRNPDYANTLTAIAKHGADIFYTGEIAARMVDDIAAHSGLLGARDLAEYRPRLSQPLESRYRGRRVTTNAPPGGGVMLLEMLNILEHFDLAGMRHNSAEYIMTVAEAMKRVTIDKDRFVSDPGFVEIPLERLLSKDYAHELAQDIQCGHQAHVTRLHSPAPATDTTQVSVVDGEGGCVSLTHSLAMPSGVITPGLGFFYNGGMAAFDPRPNRAASIAPGKARFTGMCPSIVFQDKEPVLVIGAPGGTQIPMGVLQAILNVIDFKMTMQEAVAAPRFSATSDLIDLSNRIPRAIGRALEAKGYEVARNPFSHTIAWVHAIQRADGRLEGAADPGRDGVALDTDAY